MERLDYRINENGMERRASREKVVEILGRYLPQEAEHIEHLLRKDGFPFEFILDGINFRIEYRGPVEMAQRL